MAHNPPEGTQRIIPYITYADAPAAIEFLCKAFGFEERFRLPMPDGRVGHAELGYRDSVVMLSSVYEEMGLASPRDLPAHHAQIMCYVTMWMLTTPGPQGPVPSSPTPKTSPTETEATARWIPRDIVGSSRRIFATWRRKT